MVKSVDTKMLKLLYISLLCIFILGLNGCTAFQPPTDDGKLPGTTATPVFTSPLKGGELVDGLIGDVRTMAVDEDNILWISAEGGLEAFSGIIANLGKKFQVFDRYNTNFPLIYVTQILVTRDNKKWFGNGWGDVFTYDNERWEVLPKPEKIYSIIRIKQDNQGKVWVLGSKDEPDSMKSRYTLWSYQGSKIDKVFSAEFARLTVGNLAIDMQNNIWIGTGDGVYRYDGQSIEKSKDVVIPVSNIMDIIYNPINDELLIASQRGYAQPSRIFYNANIYRYKNGKLDTIIPENSELISLQPGSLYVDNKGNLWVIYYNQSIATARFNGKEWSVFGSGTPLSGLRVNSIVSDKDNRTFFGIIHPTSSGKNIAMLDGDFWSLTPLPVLKHDPRIWWRQEDISELFKHPVVPVKIQEVLLNPLEYRGKKISFVAKIKSGFEYAAVVDMDGKVLNIWPEYQVELNQVLTDIGIVSEVEKSEYKEFIGYLEFGGGYGHLGSSRFGLFITEIYPYSSEQQKANYRDLFEKYVKPMAQDKQAIKKVIDQWVSAIKTGNVEGLKQVYHSGSVLYKYLLTQRGIDEAKKNIMDITILSMDIRVAGTNAYVNINDATVKPERPGSSIPGGTGIFKLRSLSLAKDNGLWKIFEYNYTPDPPSIPPQKAS